MPQYYKLFPGENEKAWHVLLKETFPDGSPVDIWAYRGGRRLEQPQPVPFTIQVDGDRIDYYDSAFGATVTSKRLAELWQQLAASDIQRIPAIIEGDSGEWEVVNIIPCVECIDYERSKVPSYHPKRHPHKPGKPTCFLKLMIDPARVGDHQIFHPVDWQVVTIVSEKVKQSMEAAGITGVSYIPVTE